MFRPPPSKLQLSLSDVTRTPKRHTTKPTPGLRMEPRQVATTFRIISDTHSMDLHNQNNQQDEAHLLPFHLPMEQTDVLLHCGDLTMMGDLEEYEAALELLKAAPAKHKFAIAGNHDRSLDRHWWQTHPRNTANKGMEYHEAAVDFWKVKAREAGVELLDEGLHVKVLGSGAVLRIYASPYQPDFYDWAFAYQRHEDRFNKPGQTLKGAESIATNPIPDFPHVDVVMTHGPPYDVLDRTASGPVGCANLSRAMQRARPLLYCFGHIHEGNGVETVEWSKMDDSQTLERPDAVASRVTHPKFDDEGNAVAHLVPHWNQRTPDWMQPDRNRTVCINASIMDVGYRPRQEPHLVILLLSANEDDPKRNQSQNQ